MQSNPAAPMPVAYADANARSIFITRTYTHLLLAVVGFTLLEGLYFTSGFAERVMAVVSRIPWLLVLGAFMLVAWLASRAAHTATDARTQYLALAGYVVAESLIFVPLLYFASAVAPGVIESAASVTLLGFGALTAIAFVTRKDFSFLRGVLMWAGVLALVAIVAATLFGVGLGIWFSVAMIGFAGAAVLYDTSNVLHHYPEDRYVAAALELFASIALLFWYVLQFFLQSRD